MNLQLPITTFIMLVMSISQITGQVRCLSSSKVVEVADQRELALDTLLTIPVVIHNLYQDESQRISESQVLAQVEVINNDFQRQNQDTIDTPSNFTAVTAKQN